MVGHAAFQALSQLQAFPHLLCGHDVVRRFVWHDPDGHLVVTGEADAPAGAHKQALNTKSLSKQINR